MCIHPLLQPLLSQTITAHHTLSHHLQRLYEAPLAENTLRACLSVVERELSSSVTGLVKESSESSFEHEKDFSISTGRTCHHYTCHHYTYHSDSES